MIRYLDSQSKYAEKCVYKSQHVIFCILLRQRIKFLTLKIRVI
jgi:hypothetical protein